MGKAQNKEVNNKELIKLKDSGEEPKRIRSEKLKKNSFKKQDKRRPGRKLERDGLQQLMTQPEKCTTDKKFLKYGQTRVIHDWRSS